MIADNQSDSAGGGLEARSSASPTPIEIVDTAILDNTASSRGGGLNIEHQTTIDRCLIAGNTAGNGGAIRHGAQVLTLINTTVTGNHSTGGANTAAGISNLHDLVLRHVTLTANTNTDPSPDPRAFGDLYLQLQDEVTFESTVVAGECGTGFGATVAVSLGGNVESPGDTCTLTHGTDQVAVDPGDLDLQPLADNGGPTPTHALGPASVALGAAVEADCPATDQRGFLRDDGDCDSGAFERGATDPAIFADGFESGDTAAWSASVP